MRTVGPAGQSSRLRLPHEPLGFSQVFLRDGPSPLAWGVHQVCKMRSQRNDTRWCLHLLCPRCSPPPLWDKTPSPRGRASGRGCDRCAMCRRTGCTQESIAALQLACSRPVWWLWGTVINDEPLEGQLCRRIQEWVQQLGAAPRGPLPVARLLPESAFCSIPSSASLKGCWRPWGSQRCGETSIPYHTVTLCGCHLSSFQPTAHWWRERGRAGRPPPPEATILAMPFGTRAGHLLSGGCGHGCPDCGLGEGSSC